MYALFEYFTIIQNVIQTVDLPGSTNLVLISEPNEHANGFIKKLYITELIRKMLQDDMLVIVEARGIFEAIPSTES